MAKNSVADWDTTAANNTDIGGISILGAADVKNFDNAFREMMAQVKTGVPVLTTTNTFTKIQKWAKGADVASASALTLGDDGNYFDITGTAAITSIATKGVGTVVKLHFDAALTLTHHATDLILPGGANIITAAGDEAEFVEYATGDWRCTNYEKADGLSAGFKSGCVIGSAYTEYTTYFGSADAIPVDDTIPQSTEGSGIMSLNYTPKSVSNKLRIRAVVQASADALRNIVAALFVGSGSSAVKTAYAVSGGAGYHVNIVLEYEMLAGATTAIGIAVRAGPGGAGTCYFNGLSSGRLFGGTSGCSLTVEEIKP